MSVKSVINDWKRSYNYSCEKKGVILTIIHIVWVSVFIIPLLTSMLISGILLAIINADAGEIFHFFNN